MVLEVSSHNGIIHRLIPDVHLLCQGAFAQIQQGGSHAKLIAEGIVKPRPHHRFGLYAKKRIALQRHLNVATGFQQSIVDDSDAPQLVVDRVILVFD